MRVEGRRDSGSETCVQDSSLSDSSLRRNRQSRSVCPADRSQRTWSWHATPHWQRHARHGVCRVHTARHHGVSICIGRPSVTASALHPDVTRTDPRGPGRVKFGGGKVLNGVPRCGPRFRVSCRRVLTIGMTLTIIATKQIL